MKFGTKAVHAGVKPDPSTGAIMTPIYQTSTYAQASPGDHKGFAYGRGQNPTRAVLQESIALLENGKHGLVFGSGVAAIDAVLKLLRPGDEVISGMDIYGGTYRIFRGLFEQLGIKFCFVDLNDMSSIEERVNDKTKLIWVETPTNPMMSIVDLKGIVQIAKRNKLLVAVDNTFASPALQNPLDLGVDIVMHSATKYLSGHSDVLLGALVVKDADLFQQLAFIQNTTGAIPGPQDCFLVLRGIKTLSIRMERHCQNGEKIASYLKAQSKVAQVYWPGFEDHPNHQVALAQMKGFGGMISFTFHQDDQTRAFRFLENLKLFALAESLGGVESLANHPATMTHGSVPKEERLKIGLLDSMIRLSVGIEDADDLIADLEQAFQHC